jgi:hypothetical protein
MAVGLEATGCSLALMTACPALSNSLLACLRLIGWKNIKELDWELLNKVVRASAYILLVVFIWEQRTGELYESIIAPKPSNISAWIDSIHNRHVRVFSLPVCRSCIYCAMWCWFWPFLNDETSIPCTGFPVTQTDSLWEAARFVKKLVRAPQTV